MSDPRRYISALARSGPGAKGSRADVSRCAASSVTNAKVPLGRVLISRASSLAEGKRLLAAFVLPAFRASCRPWRCVPGYGEFAERGSQHPIPSRPGITQAPG